MLHQPGGGRQRTLGGGQQIRSTGELAESHQRQGGHGVAAGHGIVVEIFLSRDQFLVIDGGVEEAAGCLIFEPPQHRVDQRHRFIDPALVEVGLVQRNERGGQAGIVVQVGIQLCLAPPPGVQQSPIVAAHVFEHEPRRPLGRLEIAWLVQHAGRLGERLDHQSVPCHQHLVVEARVNAFLARRQQHCPIGCELLCQRTGVHAQRRRALGERVGQIENALAVLEVSVGRHVIHAAEGLGRVGAEHFGHFLGRPHEELAFGALAVGVLRAVEAAGGVGHLAEHIVARFANHAGEVLVAGHAIGVEITRHEQPVVVEHFFEVGRQPALVDRIAMKSASELIVHPAGGHPVEREGDHVQQILVRPPLPHVQQQSQVHRVRKLRRGAKPTVRRIERAG